jgi:autotransporter-associated beta strand protein
VGYTVLIGTNTFSGTLAVNGTTLGGGILLSNSQAAGTGLINIAGVNNRSTLQLAGGITLNNNFLISQRPNGSTVPHIANIGGTNTLAGLMTLTSGGNLWMLSADAGQMIVAGISNSVGGFARSLYLQGAASGVVTNLIDGSQAWLQLVKNGAGTWTLAGPASLGAGIQVNAGTLVVDGNVDSGTAAGNATVSGGNLIVNGTLPGTVTVANTAALGGAGIITNAVTVQAGGTLAPGLASTTGTATLTLNSDLTLVGNASFKLNKSLAQSNDFVVVNGALNNTGAGNVLTVANAGPALVAGDKFTLFSQPLAGGGSLTVTGGGSGVTWANNLAVDGSISVLTASPVVNTNTFAVGAAVSGNSLNLSWPSDRLGWMVQVQTNTLGAGLGTNWVTLTNSAAGTNYSLPISPANPSVFIRMVYP